MPVSQSEYFNTYLRIFISYLLKEVFEFLAFGCYVSKTASFKSLFESVFFADPLYIPFLVFFTLRYFEYSIFLRKVPKRTMAVVRFQLRGVLNSNSKSNSCCCCCFYSQMMYLRKTKAYATYIYPPFDAIILLGRKTHKDKCIK